MLNNNTNPNAPLLQVMAQQDRKVIIIKGETKMFSTLSYDKRRNIFEVKDKNSNNIEFIPENVSDIRGNTIILKEV